MSKVFPTELPQAGHNIAVQDLSTLKDIKIPVDMPLIDAHAHYGGEHPAVIDWMAKNKLKVVNIGGGKRGETFGRLIKEHPNHYGWITSISVPQYDEEGFTAEKYAEEMIATLKEDVANGAVGVKVFKSIGLMVQKPDGSYLQIDDPIFEPVFAWMEEAGVTLIAHVAEAMGCWKPLDDPKNAYAKYYTNHPNYYMGDKPDRLHHSDIMAARDNVVAKYPKMKFVGAHFGCMEYDVDEIAKRMDKYPNFAVDTCGWTRIIDLSFQDRDKVREFIIKYQDRIMFGTDRSVRGKGQLEMTEEELAASLWEMTNAMKVGWDYYATDKTVNIKGFECEGLALPEDVLEKLFYSNAKKWYPGL